MLKSRPNRNPLAIAALGITCALAMPVYAQSASDCSYRAERAALNTYGVVGGTAGAVRNSQAYNRAYDDCMAGRYR